MYYEYIFSATASLVRIIITMILLNLQYIFNKLMNKIKKFYTIIIKSSQNLVLMVVIIYFHLIYT